MLMFTTFLQCVYCMYQKLQTTDIHRHGSGPPIAMVFHRRRVPDLSHDLKLITMSYEIYYTALLHVP